MRPQESIRFFIVLLSAFLILSHAYADDAKLARCGLIVPLSGPVSLWGNTISNSVRLAMSESEGVEFLIEDDSFNPANTVAAFKKLTQLQGVKCVMVFGSSTANAIAGLAETAQIPTFAIAVSPKIIEGRKFAFLLHVPIMRELKVIFDGVRAHGYKRVAIISATHDATLSLREGFVREFSNSRELQIVSDQEIQPAESDVRTVALRAIAAKPDAIFLNVLPPQAGLTAMQLKSLGFNGGIFGGPPLMNDSEVHAAKGALEGAWAVGVNPTFSQSFVEKYRTKFGESPESTSGTLSYDGAKILARIARGEPVSTVLKNGNTFSGALGTYTLIDQSFDIPGSAWVVRNGKSTQQDAH